MQSHLLLAVSSLLAGLLGCAVPSSPTSTPSSPPTTSAPGTTPSGPYRFLSGNWQFTPVPTAGPVPFTALAGYLDEFNNNVGISDFSTAALHISSTTCFADQSTVPLTGGVTPTHAAFQSFPIDLQVLDLSGNKNSTVTQLSGSYSISGGCGNGASGTLNGQLYSPLSGIYSGAILSTPTHSLQVTLAQNATGTSDGRSYVTGSATFSGFSCFTSGKLVQPYGWVVGSALSLTFQTNEPSSSSVILTGSFNAAADMLTLSSVVVTGGSCAASLGTATLTL